MESLSKEEMEDILSTLVKDNGRVGITLKFDQAKVLQFCLYSLDVPLAKLSALPSHFDTFLQKCPSLQPTEVVNLGWSFGKGKPYRKIEKMYHGVIGKMM